MKHIKLLCILLIVSISLLCVYSSLYQNDINIETVSGRYQTKIKQDISQLMLSKDGNYEHKYQGSQSSCSSKGRWHIENSENNKVLVLEDSDLITLGTINNTCTGNRGYVMLQINQFLGKIELVYDIDLGLSYEKLPDRF